MMLLRRSADRGQADHGWLQTQYSFSFADYYDPAHMGFGPLRVINEDRIAPEGGFPTHGHQNMEIITYIVEGSLAHKDSMGNSAQVLSGEIQRMSAGTGVRHSEFNPKGAGATHLLQIWVLPKDANLPPSYGQKSFAEELARGGLTLVASRDGRAGSVSLNQDLELYAAKQAEAGERQFAVRVHGHQWVQVVKGEVTVNGERLGPGDGAGLREESQVTLQWSRGSEFLFFDMP